MSHHVKVTKVSSGSKVFADTILCRLSETQKKWARETRCLPTRSKLFWSKHCVTNLKNWHPFRWSTINSVEFHGTVSMKDESKNVTLPFKTPHANRRNRVRTYGDLSPEFVWCSSGIFFFAFSLPFRYRDDHEGSRILVRILAQIWAQRGYCDLACTRVIMLFIEDPCRLQVFISIVWTIVCVFGMRCAPLKCKVLLQNWITSRRKQ